MPSFEELTDDQRAQLGKTLFAMLGDKDTSKAVKQLIAKKNPNYKDPELLIDEQLSSALDPLKKQVEAMSEERTKEKIKNDLEKVKDRCEARGLKFEDVEKFAVENSIADYDKAIYFMERDTQSADPTPPTLNTVNPTEDVNKLLLNPTALKQTRLARGREAVTEVMRGKRLI